AERALDAVERDREGPPADFDEQRGDDGEREREANLCCGSPALIRLPLTLAIISTLLVEVGDRKSTRLNSSHRTSSYAVLCVKKKKECARHGGSGRIAGSKDRPHRKCAADPHNHPHKSHNAILGTLPPPTPQSAGPRCAKAPC